MAAIQINNITDPVFGNCVQLTNGLVDMHVTVDFGPRVIYCACAGMANMFYQDTAKKTLGEKFDVFDDQLVLYGGHRLWFSPEIVPRCYHPDNEPVTVTLLPDGAIFTAAVEKHNQIQKILTFRLEAESPVIKVKHAIRNVGLWDIELALWGLTMMDKGGQAIMPMPDRKTGFLSNRNISLWDYSEMNDSRVYWGKSYIALTQNPAITHPFKLGYNNEAGWAAYFNKGQVFVKHFEPSLDGYYPDNGCCYESYVNHLMVEMETLGESVSLGPDEIVSEEEEWALYPATHTPTTDEAALAAIMAKYL